MASRDQIATRLCRANERVRDDIGSHFVELALRAYEADDLELADSYLRTAERFEE